MGRRCGPWMRMVRLEPMASLLFTAATTAILCAGAVPLACGGTVAPQDSVDASSHDAAPPRDAGHEPPSLFSPGDGGGVTVSHYIGTCPILTLDPDAAPYTCRVAPADVACTVDSDCVVYTTGGCGCPQGAIGVNTSSTVACSHDQPCPVPPPGSCMQSGFVAEDCYVTTDLSDIAARCVDEQCTSYVVGAP